MLDRAPTDLGGASPWPTKPTAARRAAAAAAPKLQILTQYVRDLSFENIAAQKGLATDGKPDVKVQVNLDAQQRPGDRYEVALKLKVDFEGRPRPRSSSSSSTMPGCS